MKNKCEWCKEEYNRSGRFCSGFCRRKFENCCKHNPACVSLIIETKIKTRFGRNKHFDRSGFILEFLGGKCVRCGYDKCKRAMHIHHTQPKIKDKQWKNIIEKCDKGGLIEYLLRQKVILLCANCHAEVHEFKEKKYLEE